MVEELHPTILDNFGLFAALKSSLSRASKGTEAHLSQNFPANEPQFTAADSTAPFRIAEEAINMIFRRDGVRSLASIWQSKRAP